MEDPDASVVVNLIGVKADDRPSCFNSLLTAIEDVRLRAGRPHWLVVDEAPSCPASRIWASRHRAARRPDEHHFHHGPPEARVVVGREPRTHFDEFAAVRGIAVPQSPADDLERGHAALWFLERNEILFGVKRSLHARNTTATAGNTPKTNSKRAGCSASEAPKTS